jgi:hypothetical protein
MTEREIASALFENGDEEQTITWLRRAMREGGQRIKAGGFFGLEGCSEVITALWAAICTRRRYRKGALAKERSPNKPPERL